MLNNYFQHSHTSRTIASSQYHPRETRPLLSQPNLYENCYIGLTYVEDVSYITRNESIYLLTHFFLLSHFRHHHTTYEGEWVDFAYSFFFYSAIFTITIQRMKLSRSILLTLFFSTQLFSSSPYNVWSWVDEFSWTFFFLPTQLFSFSLLNFHIQYEVESPVLAELFFFYSAIFAISIRCMKLSESF
jgi:hypothetical protein